MKALARMGVWTLLLFLVSGLTLARENASEGGFSKVKLDNGSELWLFQRESELCYLSLTFGRGYLDEPSSQRGITALALAVICRTNSSQQSLFDAGIRRLGGTSETIVESRATHVRMQVPADKTQEALVQLNWHLSSWHPPIGADVHSAKTALFARLSEAEKKVDSRMERALREALYWPSHPYYGEPLGDAQSVSSISDRQVLEWRVKLLKTPALLTVVGPHDEDQVRLAANYQIGAWHLSQPALVEHKVESGRPAQGLLVIDTPGQELSEVMVAFEAPNSKLATSYAEHLAMSCLNHADGQRLLLGLREKYGLIYTCAASLTKRPGSRIVKVRTATKIENTARCLQFLLDALEDFEKFGPFNSELKAAKARLSRSLHESDANVKAWRRSCELTWLRELKWRGPSPAGVSLHAVRGSAGTLFARERRIIILAGDLALLEPQLRSAGFRDFEVWDPTHSFFHWEPLHWPQTPSEPIHNPWPY